MQTHFFRLAPLIAVLVFAGCETSTDEDVGGRARKDSDTGSVCTRAQSKLETCGIGPGQIYVPGECQDEPLPPESECAYSCVARATCQELVSLVCDGSSEAAALMSCYYACLDVEIATCTDGRVIPSFHVCDGDADCSDGADEANCPVFTCADGSTIPARWECNGDEECSDSSDEHRDCDYYFICADGAETTYAEWKCDGYANCSDGSDEANCPTFSCNDGSSIAAAQECDYSFDCPDRSDEHGGCEDIFFCANGTEVTRASYKCDGYESCSDGSDETNCPSYFCADGTTIPATSECNASFDCPDGSDEHGGCANIFLCANGTEVISVSWECDGYEDCSDGWDEANCPVFTCVDGSSIYADQECDRSIDCADGSDEHSACPFQQLCGEATPNGEDDVQTQGTSDGGDASMSNGDAGSANTEMSDAGGGSSGSSGGSLELGQPCTYGTDACGDGKVCTSIFLVQGTDMPNTSTAACYAACDTAGEECTAAMGQTGVCQQSTDGNVCVAASGNLQRCGNGANASCTTTPVCAFGQDDAYVGLCVTVCTPGNESTCSALTDPGMPNDGCGCSEDQACSVSNLGFQGGDGVCASPSQAGDLCGFDTSTNALAVCTGEQICDGEQGATTGTCASGT